MGPLSWAPSVTVKGNKVRRCRPLRPWSTNWGYLAERGWVAFCDAPSDAHMLAQASGKGARHDDGLLDDREG